MAAIVVEDVIGEARATSDRRVSTWATASDPSMIAGTQGNAGEGTVAAAMASG
jgi:hypothetical protein